MEPVGVAGDLDRLLGQLEPPPVVGRDDPGVGHRLHEQPREVDGVASQWPAGVEPGQQQEVLDHRGHPGRLLLDLPERGPHGPLVVRTAPGQLGVPRDRRQRSPQLVRGVRHELPHLLLAAVPLGQRVLDVHQEGVEGGADLAHLGPDVGELVGHARCDRDLALGERQAGDRVRRRRHLTQRPQLTAYDVGAGSGGGGDTRQAEQDLPRDQLRDRAVHRGRRQADREDAGFVRAAEVERDGSGDRGDPILPETRDGHLVRPPVRGYRRERSHLVGRQRPTAAFGRQLPAGLTRGPAGGHGSFRHRIGTVVRVPGRTERPGPCGDAIQGGRDVLVETVREVAAEGQGGGDTDQRDDDGHEGDGRDHQPRGEGREQPRHDVGFSTYPAPRMVWIIGSRPASIFLRR